MLLLLCMAGVTGCIYTGDIFNFFVMLEVLAISSYSLVAFFKKRKWALEASLSYAFIGAIATSFFFFGAIFLYAGLGSLNIADIAAKVNGLRADGLYVWSGGCIDSQCFGNVLAASAMAIAFMLWALTFEAGIFPNNYWLPSAYTEAPSPASALFAGIVDKVGTYGIIRLFVTMFTPYSTALMIKLLGIPFRDLVLYILSVLGLATGFIGALIMILQNDIKRLLSYSTISHIGLIFMAFAALTSATPEVAASIALMGIVFHSITHALGESMLFMGLGALATFAKSRKLKDLQGYGKLYPAISIAVGVGALSLLGVPPLGGFFSKYALFMALSSANLWIYAVSIVLVSGISAIGYFKVLYALFMQKPTITKRGGSSVIVSAVCILMAVALLFVGILYMNGELYEVLYRGCSDVLPPKGLKGYVYAVEEAARVLGMTP
uniref:NADH:quinone oxidoreductase/Mrp antiporter transmembrane domain-containing protein n=1 Tax=Ignisphaera aggregans TaxID=334771 RepID=A0A7C2ZS39_9CREN